MKHIRLPSMTVLILIGIALLTAITVVQARWEGDHAAEIYGTK